ncbi:phage antirepressor KilAC domain-containing protein [Massilia sp.]|uniref:phage antirepressor KilAC domain-containing protein n=1 Tax=Massilia sp. TaxID=1882437 RepID=UPI00352C1AF6
MSAPQQAAHTSLTTAVATMSSMEIVSVINEERKADAEAAGTRFVELRHDNFLVKIEKHPGIQSPKFLGDYTDERGRTQKCYYLPKREAELMVMSESLKVQTRVYDRLAEKEAATGLSAPNFDDPIAVAEAWIAAKKAAREEEARNKLLTAEKQQLTNQVAELAPAAAGLELIAGADGTMCITDAAKTLQMQPYKLRDALLEMKWMYRRQGKGGYVAYQPTIHSGYLVHKVANYQDPETGEQKSNAQVLVTRKGLAKLAKLLSLPAPPSSAPRLN